ncbi:MAG: 7TM diverse intracellular signaling domain-containing protein [Novosphingobium sp.]
MKPLALIACLRRALLALLVSMLAGISPALASPQAVDLPQGDGFIQPFRQTGYLLDSTGQMGLTEVLQASGSFRPVARRWIDFGERHGRIWIATRVANSGYRDGQWMLDLQRQWIDSVEVWKIGMDGTRTSLLQLSAVSPLSERPVRSRYIAVPLDMKAGETADILIGYSSHTGSWLPLTFATQDAYRSAHMREERINWTLNGALLALIVIALALGRIAGWRLSLSYCAYALAAGLLVANNEGYLFRFLWPAYPALYDRANLVLLLALIAAGLYFSRVFTEFQARRPRLDRVLLGFLGLVIVAIPLAAFLPASDFVHNTVYAAAPLGAIAYLGLAASAVKARVLGAVPFAIGACALAFTLGFGALVLAFPGQYALTVALDYVHATI